MPTFRGSALEKEAGRPLGVPDQGHIHNELQLAGASATQGDLVSKINK